MQRPDLRTAPHDRVTSSSEAAMWEHVWDARGNVSLKSIHSGATCIERRTNHPPRLGGRGFGLDCREVGPMPLPAP